MPDAFDRLPDAFDALPEAAPASATATARPGARQPNFNRTILPDLARATANAAPGIGALGGGLLGELAGIPAAPLTGGTSLAAGPIIGSMIGGKAGEWARYGLAPFVGLPQEIPGPMGPSDLLNATLAGAGRVGSNVAQGAGRGIYAAGISPGTARLSRMPDLLERMAERKLIPSSKAAGLLPGLKRSVELEKAGIRSASKAGILGRARSQSEALTTRLEGASDLERQAATTSSKSLIKQATQSGRRFTAQEAAGPALANAELFNRGPLNPSQQRKVIAQVQDALDEAIRQRSHGVRTPPVRLKPKESPILDPYGLKVPREAPPSTPKTYSASDLDAVRQFYFNRTKSAAAQRGVVSPLSPIEDDIHAGLQEALKGGIPGLAEARAAEQQAIQTAQAIKSGGLAAVNRMARRGSPLARQAVEGREAIRGQVGAESGRAGAMARTGLTPSEPEFIIRQAQLAAANRNPWLTRVGFPTALIPQIEAVAGLGLMNPSLQRAIQYGGLAGQVPWQMFNTPPPMSPQETLPPNPPWGGKTP